MPFNRKIQISSVAVKVTWKEATILVKSSEGTMTSTGKIGTDMGRSVYWLTQRPAWHERGKPPNRL